MLQIDLDKLKKVIQDFYHLTGFQTVLYDEQERFVYSYPESMCSFCTLVRGNQQLADICLKCDTAGFEECRKRKDVYIYQCFMGLTEAMAPIDENGIIIGYLMFGQILDPSHKETVLKRIQEVSEGKMKEELTSQLSKITVADHQKIISAVNMMTMCACYLWYHHIISVQENALSYQLTQYLEAHLDQDITVSSICRDLYLSRSALYKLSTAAFGMGISEYVLKMRIHHAKKMLKKGNEKISEIAAKVGIPDANYFTRCFTKQVGMPPKEYRRKG